MLQDNEYEMFHNLVKILNDSKIISCSAGNQKTFLGHAMKDADIKFTVVQNRKNHRKRKILSYVLMVNNQCMIRVDIDGKMHNGVKTPHMHICNKHYNNGSIAIDINKLKNYDGTDDPDDSLAMFLRYNNFNLEYTHFDKNNPLGV